MCPERLRCEPPFLHEGMTTTLSGEPIGKRLQLVTDPDWFNTRGALEELTRHEQAAQSDMRRETPYSRVTAWVVGRAH